MGWVNLFDYLEYQSYLNDELNYRKKINKQYSLRAFARDLAISPSLVSSVIHNTRHISGSNIEKLSASLGFTEDEKQYFREIVAYSKEKNPALRESTYVKIRTMQIEKKVCFIEEETLKSISSWYHFAILSYFSAENADSYDPEVISNRFNINVHLIKEAIQRLVKIGYLIFEVDKFKTVINHTRTSIDIPSATLQKLNSQFLQKAIYSLKEIPPLQRNISSNVFNIDVDKIQDAKKEITEFKRKLMEKYETTNNDFRTFSFTSAFFPLDKDLKPR